MRIGGIANFDLMSSYNRIDYLNKQAEVNQSAVNETKNADNKVDEKVAPVEAVSGATPLKVNLNLDSIRKNASLEDISLDFMRREPFSLEEVDGDNQDSVMSKAVSQMEKDESLKQYQVFVGESNVVFNDEDGIVIRK